MDIYEKLPVPYGLIRYGVAPDNLGAKVRLYKEVLSDEILTSLRKNAINLYNMVLDDKRVRLLANVEIGKHIKYRELLKFYDAVVLAVGVGTPRIPSKEYLSVPNVFVADSFVKWYNGHPQFANTLKPDLITGENMVILGHGNVSFDIVRTMLTPVDLLKTFDIPSGIVEMVKKSRIRHISVVGRRGLEEVKFTPKEVRSIVGSPYIDITSRSRGYIDTFSPDEAAKFEKAVGLLYGTLKTPSTKGHGRVCELEFFSTIEDIVTDPNSGRLIAVKMLKISGDHTETYMLPCDLLVFSYGYDPSVLEDIRLGLNPFIEVSRGENARAQELPPNMFISGFRAVVHGYNIPNSIIVAKVTAHDVHSYLCRCKEDSGSHRPYSAERTTHAIEKRLSNMGVEVVNYQGWLEINRSELKAGKLLGKAREKIVSQREIISTSRK